MYMLLFSARLHQLFYYA